MLDKENFFSQIFDEALQQGESIEPASLLEIMKRNDSPFDLSYANPGLTAAFSNLREEYKFIDLFKSLETKPSEMEREIWIKLMRWSLYIIKNWSSYTHIKNLTASIAIFINYIDVKNLFWNSLPEDYSVDGAFLDTILLALKQTDLRLSALSHDHISTNEFIVKFNTANEEKDIVALSKLWPRIEHIYIPNFFVTQITKALFKFSKKQLFELIRTTDDFPKLIHIIRALKPIQIVCLSLELRDSFISFACVFGELRRLDKASITEIIQDKLSLILIDVAKEKAWKNWLKVFNQFPSRYLFIQKPLGRALASLDVSHLQDYVNSINLNANLSASSFSVEQCLTEFKKCSSSKHSHEMWEMIFEKWLSWISKFGSEDKYVFEIVSSEFDYGVISYYSQFSENILEGQQDELIQDMLTIRNVWHSSMSVFISRFLVSLSKFQLLSRAILFKKSGVISNELFLPKKVFGSKYIEHVLSDVRSLNELFDLFNKKNNEQI